MGATYLRAGEVYVALHERPYDAESVLQELIERHPQMLAGARTAGGRPGQQSVERGRDRRVHAGAAAQVARVSLVPSWS